jgi:N-acetylglucosaminyldiphosphoundecaprenol N-acetyl-beta-D-mannosaminyltransferase
VKGNFPLTIERFAVPRANVLGVGVSAIHLAQAVELILRGVRNGEHGYITVTGVHGVMEAQADPEFRSILNRAWMTTPDGMPMTWVGRCQGHRAMDRVYGPDLMRDIFKSTQDGSVRHFFYGGAPGVAELLKRSMEARFPGVVVCGTFTPPFRALTAAEEEELEGIIRDARPHLIWVGLSTPKQERFMAAHEGRFSANFMLGVGAAFDMHSGRTKQAPLWMQRSGLEWFFRLCQEPRRLARRYLVNNPRFVARICTQALGLRRYDIEI